MIAASPGTSAALGKLHSFALAIMTSFRDYGNSFCVNFTNSRQMAQEGTSH